MRASGAIAEIALIFVTSEDFDSQINKALAIVGNMLGVSRCCLFFDSADGTTTSNTHEWCADGFDSQMADLQSVPYSAIPSWKDILEHEIVRAVEDIATLPADVNKWLEPQKIRSVIFAPLWIGDSARGFLGFEECTRFRVWSGTEIETLKTIVGIISTAYAKELFRGQVSASEENFRTFFNTVEDIIIIADLDGRLVFASEGASRKLGYSLDEFLGMHIVDLHPPDKRDEARQILDSVFQKEPTFCALELWTRDRVRLPVETRIWFGRWNDRECLFDISKDLSAEQAALQRFESLFRNNPAPMAVSGTDDGRVIDINDAFVEKLGYAREEIIGHTTREIGILVDDGSWARVREELLSTGTVRNRELAVRNKAGELIYGLLSGDTIPVQGQQMFLTVMVDITPQLTLQAELEVEHTRLSHIIEGTRLGTWEWNVQTGETIFNDRWAEMIGYELSELQPTTIETWSGFVHPDDLKESERLLDLHFKGITDFYECECRMRHQDGSWIWILDRGSVIERDSENRPLKMYGTHADITERKEMEERIRELSIHDPLTQIYNRRYIFDQLETIGAEYERRGRNFCISILDIDHFKKVNDTYGHQAGDFALKGFTKTIRSTIRQYDLLGRYGGEEFIIVSPSASGPETAILIERIMGILREKEWIFEGREIRFTFSCGVADSSEFARDPFSIDEMIALADKRLYAAKEAGRDRCIGP